MSPPLILMSRAARIRATGSQERVVICLRAAEEHVLQYHGVVMGLIMGREHECDPAVLRQRAQPIEFVRMLPNLLAATEFLQTRGIMPEPLAQSGAGRDVFHPFIDGGIGLFHSARPAIGAQRKGRPVHSIHATQRCSPQYSSAKIDVVA